MENGSLMKVGSIAEYSSLEHSAILLTCINAIIGNENQFLVFILSCCLRQVLLYVHSGSIWPTVRPRNSDASDLFIRAKARQ